MADLAAWLARQQPAGRPQVLALNVDDLHERMGGPARPGVVWLREALLHVARAQAGDATHRADVVVVVGTSALVHPATALPMRVHQRGRPAVNINPDPTATGHTAQRRLLGHAAALLPAAGGGAVARHAGVTDRVPRHARALNAPWPITRCAAWASSRSCGDRQPATDQKRLPPR